MKILTIAIPCYNSEAYMKKAIDHAVCGGDEVEVLVIDDGSSDHTLEIAKDYENRFPGIVRAIHQENKGHGGAVNTGIENAQGVYFKVCDSDDWLDYDSFQHVLKFLKEVIRGPRTLDVLLTNFVYDKVGQKRKRMMHYEDAFPEDRIFTWDEMKHSLILGKYILMHNIIYRTELLRECGLVLPEHTFYVDNIFAFQPMQYVKTLYYLSVPLYRYFIGRDDQSVNEDVMIKRVDQQIRVMEAMIDCYRPELVKKKRHVEYIAHDMEIVMTITSMLLIRLDTEEARAQKRKLWNDLRKKDIFLYLRMRRSFLGRAVNMPGEGGRKLFMRGYKIARKLYGFN